MDAHSKKLAISIWDWSDRFNPCLHREIKAWTSKPWSRRTSDTSKEVTRTSNRMWSVYSRKGYKLPIKGGKAKTDTLRAMIAETGIGGFAKERLETLLEDYDRLLARKIAEIVLSNPRMLKLMQLQGVNYKGTFALEAAVEDRCEAHAQDWTRNAKRVRGDPGQADLRRSARSRNEDRESDVLPRAARPRFARRVARARIQTQYWGVAPAPIRGARSPEPQTRGRIRPRYPRLCSTNASETVFSHFPLNAIHT